MTALSFQGVRSDSAATRLAASRLLNHSLRGCFPQEVCDILSFSVSSCRNVSEGVQCMAGHFRCVGGLLAEFADEGGCPATAAHFACEIWATRLPFYASADASLVPSCLAKVPTLTFLKSESNIPQSYRFQCRYPDTARNAQTCAMPVLPKISTLVVVVLVLSRSGRPLFGCSPTLGFQTCTSR